MRSAVIGAPTAPSKEGEEMRVRKSARRWSRRDFLATTAVAGTGVIVIPSFLAGCRGPTGSPSPGAALFGGKGHFGQFGVDGRSFDLPTGIAVGPGDEIYVVDTNNQRIMRFGPLP